MSEAPRRRPRFRRATSDNLPGIKITPRDTEILRQLAAHRFLRSTHVFRLLGGSRDGLLRRLAALYHHGYVERPRAQLDGYFRYAGSEPMVYALAPRGAALLRSEGLAFEAMAWTRKGASSIGTQFLEHALMISDVTVAAQESCERHGVEFAQRAQLVAEGASLPHSWRVQISSATELAVVPDAIFSMGRDGEEACIYFLEADRGTMPVVRSGLDQTSFQRKLLAYHASWKARVHQREFGHARMRVLTVTSSAARLDHLRVAAAELPGGHGLFLFATIGALRESEDFLSMSWSAAGGESERLAGASSATS